MPKSRGQTFMPDYMASLVVFGFILVIFLSSWNSIISDQTEFNPQEDMRIQAVHTTSFLVSTPGFPENWQKDSVDVDVPGFAESDHVLQDSKLEAFKDLTYDKQRKLLQAEDFYLRIVRTSNGSQSVESLGAEPVAYIVEEQTALSGNEIWNTLNDSGTTWDFYYPSNMDQSSLPSLTARNLYNYTDQGEVMFEDMVENVSDGSYQTVIAEDATILSSDINNEDDLESFVQNGGTYIHIGQQTSFVNGMFGLDPVSIQGGGVGEIIDVDPFLNSSYSSGDTMEFENEYTAYKNVDKMFINDTGYGPPPTRCLTCRWDIGSGKVYFTQDALAENGNTLTTFEDAGRVFNTLYSFGNFYADADTVVPVTRNVRINQSGDMKIGKLRYVVWRDEN